MGALRGEDQARMNQWRKMSHWSDGSLCVSSLQRHRLNARRKIFWWNCRGSKKHGFPKGDERMAENHYTKRDYSHGDED